MDVSSGRLKPDCADEVFKTKCREKAGLTAPPQGLFLEKVYY
ncbi:MAG: hypothetical protein U0L88_10745 [Acutalibacteraceae bacterium]|nr:hypothetical protein [Acutalibacteraceae bacterium]